MGRDRREGKKGGQTVIIPKSESSVRVPLNSFTQRRVCPISETTQEVGHALYRVSKRGWEKERRRGRAL